jgi:hypothetical protein
MHIRGLELLKTRSQAINKLYWFNLLCTKQGKALASLRNELAKLCGRIWRTHHTHQGCNDVQRWSHQKSASEVHLEKRNLGTDKTIMHETLGDLRQKSRIVQIIWLNRNTRFRSWYLIICAKDKAYTIKYKEKPSGIILKCWNVESQHNRTFLLSAVDYDWACGRQESKRWPFATPRPN